MSKETFQRNVTNALALANADLVPDVIDSYGDLVSWKMRLERVAHPARVYAWFIMDAIPGSEIYDYFESIGLDRNEYLTIRFYPGELSNCRPVKAQAAYKPELKPVSVKPAAVEKPVSKPEPKANSRGNDVALRLTVKPGQIAWTTVDKKGGGLKQARCEVVSANDNRVKVRLTKTKRELTVPVNQLFNHVPHLVEGAWL